MDGVFSLHFTVTNPAPSVFFRADEPAEDGFPNVALAQGMGLLPGEQYRGLSFWLGAEAAPAP